MSRKPRRFRPKLEFLDDRCVPAALTWTTGAGTNDFYDRFDWVVTGTNTTPQNGPVAGDDLTYDGSVSSADCPNLGVLQIGPGGGGTGPAGPAVGESSGTGLHSLSLINGYGGTVSIVAALQVESFTLSAGDTGAISQPSGYPGNDLTVTGSFTWTGGTLNSTPSYATVNIYGGGTITLPGDGLTLTTGSTLNFGNPDTSGNTLMTTNISGSGTLLLNGQNPNAINTNAGAGVLVASELTSPGKLKGVNNGKTLTISPKSYWGYIGNGQGGLGAVAELDVAVVNNGGYFFVGTTGGQAVGAQAVPNLPANAGLSTVTLTINSGATTFGYTQQTSGNGVFEINAGCTVDVSQTKGVSVSAGSVQLTPNPNLIKPATQISTIEGNFTFSGGGIGFAGSPIKVSGNNVFVMFKVTRDVTWTGGTLVVGIDSANATNTGENQWNISGTLTIDSTQGGTPAVLVFPIGVPPAGKTWPQVITSNKLVVVKNAPTIGASDPNKDKTNYTLVPDNNVNGYDIGS